MKNWITLALSFLLSCSTAQAQTEKTLLWKIEHPQTKTNSYLVGTLHMQCSEDFKMPAKIERVLQEVEQMYLEINLSDPQEMQRMQALSANNLPISKELNAEQIQQLNTAIQPIIGMPVETFDAYGVMMLYNYAIMQSLGCSEIKSFENELVQMALQKKLPLHGFETVNQQWEVLHQSYTPADIYQQLLQIEQYGRDFRAAVKAYGQEDLPEAVRLIAQDAYMTPQAKTVMVDNRNTDWVNQLTAILPTKKTMIAVGSAHLVGQKGLIAQLRAAGYRLTPVFE